MENAGYMGKSRGGKMLLKFNNGSNRMILKYQKYFQNFDGNIGILNKLWHRNIFILNDFICLKRNTKFNFYPSILLTCYSITAESQFDFSLHQAIIKKVYRIVKAAGNL